MEFMELFCYSRRAEGKCCPALLYTIHLVLILITTTSPNISRLALCLKYFMFVMVKTEFYQKSIDTGVCVGRVL